MTHEIGRHPGAVWRKCDLQCHTPRDRGWRQSEQDVPTTDAARAEWANLFIGAARDKGLSIVAVTDHHDIAMLSNVLRRRIDIRRAAYRFSPASR